MRSALLPCSLCLLSACTTYITVVQDDAGAGMDAAGAGDAGADIGVVGDAGPCTNAASCDDGLFCTGAEQCMPTAAGADLRGCVHAGSPCTATQTCDEAMNQCTMTSCDMPDADGDHHRAIACGGDDCDDTDPNRFPGNPEVCDVANHDEDCDPSTFGVRDSDGDGDPDARCCNVDTAGVNHCGTDCDDTRPGVSSTSPEVCNGRDDDCDTAIDEGVLATFYLDADNDGYGTSDTSVPTMQACSQPSGYAASGTDCNDAAPMIHPGAAEICDVVPDGGMAVDENCNMMINEDCGCTGTDSRGCMGLSGLCASGTESCISGMWSQCSVMPSIEVCDGLDNNCDGNIDEGLRIVCYLDADQDGYAILGTAAETPACMGSGGYGGCHVGYTSRNPTSAGNSDCDDMTATVSPVATEVCNHVDDNCDGVIDNSGMMRTYTLFNDHDRDGFGGGSSFDLSRDQCVSDFTGYSFVGGDCADLAANAHPAQTSWFDVPYYSCPPGLWLCLDASSSWRCTPVSGGPCTTDLPLTPPSFDYDCDGAEVSRSSTTSRLGATCATDPMCGDCVVGATVPMNCSIYPRMLDFCFTGAAPACGTMAPGCSCFPMTGTCSGNAFAGGATYPVVCH